MSKCEIVPSYNIRGKFKDWVGAGMGWEGLRDAQKWGGGGLGLSRAGRRSRAAQVSFNVGLP